MQICDGKRLVNVCLYRCLVHILKENTVRYSKIRPLGLQCQMDLCRHEVRYGCGREDDCFYAHSLIELKVWMMQHELGKTALTLKSCMELYGERWPFHLSIFIFMLLQGLHMKVLSKRPRSFGMQQPPYKEPRLDTSPVCTIDCCCRFRDLNNIENVYM